MEGAFEVCVTQTEGCGKSHVRVDDVQWHLRSRAALFRDQFGFEWADLAQHSAQTNNAGRLVE